MGGEDSKLLILDQEKKMVTDFAMNAQCAAGTGSFLDQQANRLKYDIDEIGDIVSGAEKSAKIAGRCSVFAKSDMIHAQQKGFKPEEVLKGLCEAVARNFKSSIIKSKKIKIPALFIGGVAKNSGVINAVKQVFNFNKGELRVPNHYAWMPAIGTALAERNASNHSGLPDLKILLDYSKNQRKTFSNSAPLSMKNVLIFAIIALLIAILLPSLGGARAEARYVACAANLRSIGQSIV